MAAPSEGTVRQLGLAQRLPFYDANVARDDLLFTQIRPKGCQQLG